jgi:mannose-1-phosphate guanylyltransferase/phosphomannomutase
MSVLTLVMAGGQGERVRRSIGPIPKPLLPVLGIPLLERNLTMLVRQGLRDVVVSVPGSIPEIKQFALTRGRDLMEAAGGSLDIIEEVQPRGNIGCASELRGRADVVLVILADNLTTLDLGLFLTAHRNSGAAVTLATHLESLRSAYGELDVQGGRVVAYREKPCRAVLICSGICALDARALDFIRNDQPVGMSALVQSLIDRGEFVAEYRHDAPWVDVNDAEDLRRAEVLVTQHGDSFKWEDPCPRAC